MLFVLLQDRRGLILVRELVVGLRERVLRLDLLAVFQRQNVLLSCSWPWRFNFTDNIWKSESQNKKGTILQSAVVNFKLSNTNFLPG
jgi:hypothetical protein